MEKITLKVEYGDKLLKYLQRNLENYKYSALEKALRNKDILCNKNRVKENIDIQKGDEITIYLNPSSQKKLYDIFYEDQDIVVFNKMAGIEVADGDYNIAIDYKTKTGREIFAIHRLDRNTMGLVLFAKNIKAKETLINYFQNHYVVKNYYAVVSGSPQKNATLCSYLAKNSEKSEVKIFDKKVQNSVKITTTYLLEKSLGELSLLNVEIVDGKTHQIRAHLAHFGLFILGDEKYGDNKINKKFKQTKQLLQAYKITFHIPNGEKFSYLNDIVFEQNLDKKLDL